MIIKCLTIFLILTIFVFSKAYKMECIEEFLEKVVFTMVNDELNDLLADSKCEVIDINEDGTNELFIYLDSMVNKCGYIYKKEKTSNIYDQLFLKNEICNYVIIDKIIVSNFRDAGLWQYDYFKLYEDKSELLSLAKRIQGNRVFYNNVAYNLQKAGANKEAIFLLEKILETFPNRTVAYYNLGDAYWKLGKKEKAMNAYNTYIEQMKGKDKRKKIPRLVLDRVK